MAYETGPRTHRTGNAPGLPLANGSHDTESTPLRGGANSSPSYSSTGGPYGRFLGWTGGYTRGHTHHG
ncbi:hypothetical protein FA13DRAFT_1008466 [Coprinellus micaceus]|uniref:Uncharacterized protein n=1 Tax=Coprinellus micaceus TaxID=71717 RepID=A0A4Y7SY06_COPMI|nr:hypothetical protein FA13DRAFT_1008466 [Coprinellus micaceus]